MGDLNVEDLVKKIGESSAAANRPLFLFFWGFRFFFVFFNSLLYYCCFIPFFFDLLFYFSGGEVVKFYWSTRFLFYFFSFISHLNKIIFFIYENGKGEYDLCCSFRQAGSSGAAFEKKVNPSLIIKISKFWNFRIQLKWYHNNHNNYYYSYYFYHYYYYYYYIIIVIIIIIRLYIYIVVYSTSDVAVDFLSEAFNSYSAAIFSRCYPLAESLHQY